MIGLLIQDNAFEQDIRELLMSFYPGEIYAHEVKDGVVGRTFPRLAGVLQQAGGRPRPGMKPGAARSFSPPRRDLP